MRLDDADLLVLPTLPPRRRPATNYNINWLQEKKCSTCNVTLSVEHILLHCVRYRQERRTCLGGVLPEPRPPANAHHPPG
ncbi:hypothetical protein E2C01_071449 [Portunus trituberculatus]|uniref:Uncharacterized protein n=1 Tax=Portunus trituberculatus TaxID=210409 RepID=A0A5B7HVD9_PORTR|nr:hypothetical protein [Portunus trituberculatus]